MMQKTKFNIMDFLKQKKMEIQVLNAEMNIYVGNGNFLDLMK